MLSRAWEVIRGFGRGHALHAIPIRVRSESCGGRTQPSRVRELCWCARRVSKEAHWISAAAGRSPVATPIDREFGKNPVRCHAASQASL